jgi:putative membrane protein
MELIQLICIGLILGIATVIPGVSVGTIAVVFNVYDRLITVITPNIKKILAAWKFWLPLVIGGIAGIILFSKVVTLLFTNHPVPTYWFFIGIIVGSIPMVYRRTLSPGSALPSFPVIICAILAFALMVVMAILRPAGETDMYTVLTLPLFGLLTAGGALAAAAMIIPGISGSFLLLVIGQYRTIVQAVSDFNVSLIVPVALGAILGLLIGAAFIRFLLTKAPRETYGAVLGLVVGSIIVLYPGGLGDGPTIIFSVVTLFAGSAISFISGRQKE